MADGAVKSSSSSWDWWTSHWNRIYRHQCCCCWYYGRWLVRSAWIAGRWRPLPLTAVHPSESRFELIHIVHIIAVLCVLLLVGNRHRIRFAGCRLSVSDWSGCNQRGTKQYPMEMAGKETRGSNSTFCRQAKKISRASNTCINTAVLLLLVLW